MVVAFEDDLELLGPKNVDALIPRLFPCHVVCPAARRRLPSQTSRLAQGLVRHAILETFQDSRKGVAVVVEESVSLLLLLLATDKVPNARVDHVSRGVDWSVADLRKSS